MFSIIGLFIDQFIGQYQNKLLRRTCQCRNRTGPAGFATGLAVPVLETGKDGGKTGASLLIPALKGGV
jgi:hypothetical protein